MHGKLYFHSDCFDNACQKDYNLQDRQNNITANINVILKTYNGN